MKPVKSLKTLVVCAVVGVVIGVGSLSSTAPALALGGCGANGHRNAWGHCVWGGENQNWCLRHTGHVGTWVGHGVRRCFW